MRLVWFITIALIADKLGFWWAIAAVAVVAYLQGWHEAYKAEHVDRMKAFMEKGEFK